MSVMLFGLLPTGVATSCMLFRLLPALLLVAACSAATYNLRQRYSLSFHPARGLQVVWHTRFPMDWQQAGADGLGGGKAGFRRRCWLAGWLTTAAVTGVAPPDPRLPAAAVLPH